MSKNSSKQYNFKNKEVKNKVAYRLFVVYKKNSEHYKNLKNKKIAWTYYGHFNRPDQGRGRLMSIFLERFEQIKFAILYNDIAGTSEKRKRHISKILKGNE